MPGVGVGAEAVRLQTPWKSITSELVLTLAWFVAVTIQIFQNHSCLHYFRFFYGVCQPGTWSCTKSPQHKSVFLLALPHWPLAPSLSLQLFIPAKDSNSNEENLALNWNLPTSTFMMVFELAMGGKTSQFIGEVFSSNSCQPVLGSSF